MLPDELRWLSDEYKPAKIDDIQRNINKLMSPDSGYFFDGLILVSNIPSKFKWLGFKKPKTQIEKK